MNRTINQQWIAEHERQFISIAELYRSPDGWAFDPTNIDRADEQWNTLDNEYYDRFARELAIDLDIEYPYHPEIQNLLENVD